MRESKESFLGRRQRDEESITNGRQIGLLVVLAYLAAIVMAMALGSIQSGRDFDLLIALIMLVVAYAVLRDVNALNRLEVQNSSTGPSEPRPPQDTFRRRVVISTTSADVASTRRGEEGLRSRRMDALSSANNGERNDS
jgi:hypothetical protein